MKNGVIESVPKTYRPLAKIGVNVVFKVYESNWPLWNEGIDTVMQLKEWLQARVHRTTVRDRTVRDVLSHKRD